MHSVPAAAYLCCTRAGREIAKFMAAVQAAAYGSAQPVLTPGLWDSVLQRKLFEHQERRAFRCVWGGGGGRCLILSCFAALR